MDSGFVKLGVAPGGGTPAPTVPFVEAMIIRYGTWKWTSKDWKLWRSHREQMRVCRPHELYPLTLFETPCFGPPSHAEGLLRLNRRLGTLRKPGRTCSSPAQQYRPSGVQAPCSPLASVARRAGMQCGQFPNSSRPAPKQHTSSHQPGRARQ